MGLENPIYPHIASPNVQGFAYYKVLRQSRYVLVEMIKEFFNSLSSTPQIMCPEVIQFQGDELNVFRDFPYGERKLPLVIVASSEGKEKKYYIGSDSSIGQTLLTTSSGNEVAYEICIGAFQYNTVLFLVCESVEQRLMLAELLFQCFTNHYRWQYFYSIDKLTSFSIVPNTGSITLGREQETQEKGAINLLYVMDLTMPTHVEYTYMYPAVYPTVTNFEIDDQSNVLSL